MGLFGIKKKLSVVNCSQNKLWLSRIIEISSTVHPSLITRRSKPLLILVQSYVKGNLCFGWIVSVFDVRGEGGGLLSPSQQFYTIFQVGLPLICPPTI